MIEITEPALLIRISRLYRPGMSDLELYEVTRGVWRIGPDRDRAKYALAIASGIVQEVYEVGVWQPAGSAAYATRPAKDVNLPGRWEFTGRIASEAIRSKYVGQSVAHYFDRGNANPVNYVNIDRDPPLGAAHRAERSRLPQS